MTRCKRRLGLEVHFISLNGSNGLDNAYVLCPECRRAASLINTFGKIHQPFAQITKYKALIRSGKQCQCTSTRGCH